MFVLRKADIALIVVFTTAAVLGFVYITSLRSSGGYADITRHGSLVHSLELSRDGVYASESGGQHNVIEISGGFAVMTEANCPDGHCLHQPPITYTGQTIVCLPNRLVVQIRAAAYGELDIILR